MQHDGRMRPLIAGLAGTALCGALVGCGSQGADSAVDGLPRASHQYHGPLSVERGRYGAAAEALDCPPAAGQRSRSDPYGDGATSGSVEGALDTAVSEGLFLFAPTDELRLAATTSDRALLVHESGGRILMALVFRNGPATEGAGGAGWYLEAAARCDFAEFPEEFAERAGYQLWRDDRGDPVPVTEVYSTPGSAHCEWQSMTFLVLDRERDMYVQDPLPALEKFLSGPYEVDVTLPDGARDLGVERDGRHLWLAADGSYAYVGTLEHLEAWPRIDTGCA